MIGKAFSLSSRSRRHLIRRVTITFLFSDTHLTHCYASTPVAPTTTRSFGFFCKVLSQSASSRLSSARKGFHSSNSNGDDACLQSKNVIGEKLEPVQSSENAESVNGAGDVKTKWKKLKGKRAVVRWLKFFRWKKKKDYERMTAEEKILYKLKKARNKEARLVEALKKIEPPDTSETTHDPEILTPEEHFYFLKMGKKSKNYVPIGRRGIYQGVILNMHLHWKKHQTLKVIVKTFTSEEVREMATELARLSGGIVLDICDEEDTIIMYRGKNYVQPPTEIMSPKITLSRRKALDKSMYRESLREVRKFIPRLEQNLEDLKEQVKISAENEGTAAIEGSHNEEIVSKHSRLQELLALHGNENEVDELSDNESNTESESEALSDILEMDSEEEGETDKKQLYLDEIDKFPSVNSDTESPNFEEQLWQISAAWKNSGSSTRGVEKLGLDEIDRLFLRAGSLLRKKRW